MRVIYADSVFAANFIIDYLLLLAAGKVCSLPLRRRRMAAGAALGGLYAVLALIYPAPLAAGGPKLAAALLIVAAAYWGLGPYIRTAVVFLAVSAAFGGAAFALLGPGGLSPGEGYLPLSLRTLLLSFALCYAALSLVFRRRAGAAAREKIPVRVSFAGRSLTLTALRDTGNCLDSTLVAEAEALAPLFPELPPLPADATEQLMALAQLPDMAGRLRLAPCSTAAGSSMLACFRPDSLSIEGIKYIALSPARLSPDGEFNAIF